MASFSFLQKNESKNDLDKKSVIKLNVEKQANSGSYKIGDRIRHSHFGTGMIISIMDDFIKVAFPSKGIKKFSMQKAPIEKI